MFESISFKYDYPKLWKQRTAMLIYVKVLYAGIVSASLREYDTKISAGKYFPLPVKGRLIQLIFYGEDGIPFCTLRRWTLAKEKHYLELIDSIFLIKIGT